MPTRLVAKLGVLSLPLIFIACNKTQSSVATNAARVAPTPLAPASSTPTEFSQTIMKFSGEVKQGQQFEKPFASDMVFRLVPYAGNDSGWTIRIAPGADSAASSVDCIGAVETPSHGDTKREIEPAADGALQNVPWKLREFEFVGSAPDCKMAWSLMNIANYANKLSAKEREQASAKLGEIRTRHGKFSILEARSGPATAGNQHGTLEWLKFEVDLSASAGSAGKSPEATGKASGIRAMDITTFVAAHLGELNPDLADLETACGEGEKPLKSLAPILYGDLDGDGQEEAAVEGFSCLSGNGGADFSGVLKLMPDGKLAVLPIEPMPKTFKGRNAYADLRGHMVIEIKDGRLHQVYLIYTGTEANCCPEGGERRFIYRWDGHRFTLDDMIDSPSAKSGS
jgi:hypothetical protein